MKTHDCSKPESGFKNPKIGGIALKKNFQGGKNPLEQVEKYLFSVLDNRFHLLRNLSLLPQTDQVSSVLIGPPGLWLIHAFSEKGVFEINDAEFLRMDEKRGEKKPLKPNPIEILLNQTEALQNRLSDSSGWTVPVEPVLFLTHPGAHVQLNQPAVKMVMMDATSQFISKIIAGQVIYNGEKIQHMVDLLIIANSSADQGQALKDGFSLRENRSAKKSAPSTQFQLVDDQEPEVIARISRRVPFSKRQWIILTILVVVNIIVLMSLIFVVLKNAGG